MAAMNFPNGPSLGDKYPVTPIAGQPQYTWDGEKWTTVGSQISNATPSAAVPLMDATPGLPGSAAAYSRGDHVHPTDTSRAALAYVDANMVGYAAQTTTANQKAQARANVNVTKKNYIVNGGMMISQENGLNSGSIANTVYYPADCFFGYSNSTASVVTQQQLGSVFPNSPGQIYVTNTTADTSVAAGELAYVAQNLEGTRIADLKFGTASAKTITIQFTVAAPAGTYSLVICNGAVNNRVYVAEYVIAAGEANAYVVKAVTIPGDTAGTWNVDNTSAMRVTWGLMAGTTYQQAAGSWGGGTNITGSPNQFNFMGTINNLFILSNVSLTEGNVAPPFQLPDIISELALCKRYFTYIAVSGDFMATAPGQNSATPITFSPVMRGSPTMVPPAGLSNVSSTAFYSTTNISTFFQIFATATGRAFAYANVAANARL